MASLRSPGDGAVGDSAAGRVVVGAGGAAPGVAEPRAHPDSSANTNRTLHCAPRHLASACDREQQKFNCLKRITIVSVNPGDCI
jgi:hypothetical protein